jgi:hypothetical protein
MMNDNADRTRRFAHKLAEWAVEDAAMEEKMREEMKANHYENWIKFVSY